MHAHLYKKNRTSKTVSKTHGKLSKTHLKMALASCGSNNIITLEQQLYTNTTLNIIYYIVI